jgi:hypothetical protein
MYCARFEMVEDCGVRGLYGVFFRLQHLFVDATGPLSLKSTGKHLGEGGTQMSACAH